jgi:uncharacterized protein
MSFLITGILLGMATSLHCIAMCGPLLLLMHSIKGNKLSPLKNVVYHLGRIFMYSTLGFIAGSIGESLSLFGWQRKIAILLGIIVMIALMIPASGKFTQKISLKLTQKLKYRFHHLIKKSDYASQFILGSLNGLLPCGAVYIALAAAIAIGSVFQSAIFMSVFGFGTLPVLLVTNSILSRIKTVPIPGMAKKIPILLGIASMLLILRGADLGIPFISPKLNTESHQVDCCHQ